MSSVGVVFLKQYPDEKIVCNSTKVYNYNIDQSLLDNCIGTVFDVAGYSNPVTIVNVETETKAGLKMIDKNKVSIVGYLGDFLWGNDDASQSAYTMALNLDRRFNMYHQRKPTQRIETKADDYKTTVSQNSSKKGEVNMFGMDNLKFGAYNDKRVKMSFQGLAVAGKDGRYLAYKDGSSTDVTDFLMKGFDNGIFAMPVSLKQIKANDVIIHAGVPMFVIDAERNGDNATGNLNVIDLVASEKKTIVPVKSPFGFNFYTKLICLFDGMNLGNNASDDNPFGFDPMMLMFMGNDGLDMNSLMPFMLMKDGGFDGDNNMMMMFAMMNGNKDSDMNQMLPFLMMNRMK